MESVQVPDMQKGTVYYRPLRETDFNELKDAHISLFPIDYEDSFFVKAVTGKNRIFTLGAFEMIGDHESLVGFVTARLMPINEVDSKDRHHMGLHGDCWNTAKTVYILTLGVIPGHQKKGIATTLIEQLEQQSVILGARVMFLHVITYNKVAVSLYNRCKYRCVAKLEDFYSIKSGRQPDPDRTRWDAFLFSKYVPLEVGGQEGTSLPDSMVSCKHTWETCLPCMCRQLYVSVGDMNDSRMNPGMNNSGGLLPCYPKPSTSSDLFKRLFGRGKAN